jgi:hypothetical protein
MSVFYERLRLALTWAVLAVLSAVLGEFAVQFLRSRGVFRDPFWIVGVAMNAIVAVRDFPGFWPFISACAAFLLGIWLDTIVRKTYRRASEAESRAAVKQWITPRAALRLWANPQLVELAKAATENYNIISAERQRIETVDPNIDINVVDSAHRIEKQLTDAAYLKTMRDADIDVDFRYKLFETKTPAKGKLVKKDGSLGREVEIDPSLWLTLSFEEGDREMQSVRLGTIERFKEVTIGIRDEVAAD